MKIATIFFFSILIIFLQSIYSIQHIARLKTVIITKIWKNDYYFLLNDGFLKVLKMDLTNLNKFSVETSFLTDRFGVFFRFLLLHIMIKTIKTKRQKIIYNRYL